uniref:Plastid light harvesting protein n=1 Tax=Leptocylindrus danicus TaxID=163516 RepID=A0A7S2KL03_9STRA|mmetsp:Transcript_23868/g.35826  ORF Transcript_23868/g.35826 Transcript_23868/m.35826 type:complete len:223 (+) Transcript_23868:267-935(+)
MKFVIHQSAILLLTTPPRAVNAFSPPPNAHNHKVKSGALHTSMNFGDETSISQAEIDSPEGVGAPDNPEADMSIALPFLERPAILTGAIPGDVGFDPLRFSQSFEDLLEYRNSEVKHGRLAMLGSVAYTITHYFDPSHNLIPSDRFGFWVFSALMSAGLEYYSIYYSMNSAEYSFPGDLGLDPFGFYPSDYEGRRRMQLAETKHGRVAMIAVAINAWQSFHA